MITIAICDDCADDLDHLHNLILKFSKATPEIDLHVQRFSTSRSLLNRTTLGARFDIFFLSMALPAMNGIQLGEEIRKRDENAVVIIQSNSAEFALKAFHISAYQYMIKPVLRDDLFAVLKNALLMIDYRLHKSILIKTKSKLAAVRYHHIVFAEYITHSVKWHLYDGTSLTSVKSTESFESQTSILMNEQRFIRPHVSFLVNMDYVSTISDKAFHLIDGTVIPIAQKSFTRVRNQYADYILQQVNA